MRVLVSLSAIAFLVGTANADDDAKVAVGGYLETFYSLNFRLPSNRLSNFRGFDNRDRSLTLSAVSLSATATRGALTSRLVLQFGSTAATYYLNEPAHGGSDSVANSDSDLWRYVQQATMSYAARAAFVLEAGLFTSPLGPEALAVKDNWNWSRSNLFFALPFYHTGLRVSRSLGYGWSGSLHAYTGWNSVVDNNTSPTVGVTAAYSGKRLTAQLLYLGGSESAGGGRTPWRSLLDAHATLAFEHVSLMVHSNAGLEHAEPETRTWAALALYGKVQFASRAYAAARADYFREWGSERVLLPSEWISSATTTLAVEPTAGLSVRLELRHDHAKSSVFYGGNVAGDGETVPFEANRRAQDTVTLGATAWF